jgi:hypothetical protein
MILYSQDLLLSLLFVYYLAFGERTEEALFDYAGLNKKKDVVSCLRHTRQPALCMTKNDHFTGLDHIIQLLRYPFSS